MIVAVFSALSVILGAVNVVPYVISISRKKTSPSGVAYVLQALLSVATIGGFILSGAKFSVWVFQILWFLTAVVILIFGAIFRENVWQRKPRDIVVFALTVAAIIALFFSPKLAIFLSILIAVFIKWFEIEKMFEHPNRENLTSWILATLANLFAILTALLTHAALIILVALAVDFVLDCVVIIIGFVQKLAARKKLSR